MSRQSVETLMDKWMDDTEFREQFRRDPEKKIRAGGYELDKTEWQAIKTMDWSASDEELMSRVSKAGPGN